MGHRWWPSLSLIALSLLSTGSMFLGWTISGSRVRNSFETFRAAQRLGLDELMPYRVAWFLVPVCSLAVVALALVGRHSRGVLAISAVLLGVQCVCTSLVAVALVMSPLPIAVGAKASIVVAAFSLLMLVSRTVMGRAWGAAKESTT